MESSDLNDHFNGRIAKTHVVPVDGSGSGRKLGIHFESLQRVYDIVSRGRTVRSFH